MGIFDVLCSKLLAHKLLLFEPLDRERNPEHENGKEAAVLVQSQSSSGRGKNQAGVDRVADESVRPCAYEVVAFFDRDVGAPITTEYGACPVRNAEAG
jgi:hypothetical protein